MKNLPAKINGISFEVANGVMVSSRQVATKFKKRHGDILRAIKNLECSEDFIGRNFASNDFTDSKGRKQPEAMITRDGFMFLAMGFTGKEAAGWKEDFITAFNKMEAFIKEEQARSTASDKARLACPAMTLALKEARAEEGKTTKPFHYSNEHNLIYRIVLGVTKKKWCEAEDIDMKARFRDQLAAPMILAVEALQQVNTSMIEMNFSYEDRKKRLNILYNKRFAQKCLDQIVEENA